jgi:acyl-CoA reductase-like NAD-dependent aldehyde dehydrogenase
MQEQRTRSRRHREGWSITVTDVMSTSATVRTGLFIGGAERATAETLKVADPGRSAAVVGEAAAASRQDVADAVAAAKGAFPAWAALSPQERAAVMAEAIQGIAEARDEDAAILSQENGKSP